MGVSKSNLDELVWELGVELKKIQEETDLDAWSQASAVLKRAVMHNDLRPRLLRYLQETGEE